MNLEPNEMVRMWHAAEALESILWVGLVALSAALSVIAQDEVVPAVERWIWRLVGVKS